MDRKAIREDILNLVTSNLYNDVDIKPIILKYSNGLEIQQQSEMRSAIVSVMLELRNDGFITFADTATQITGRQGSEFFNSSALVRSTHKLETEQQKKPPTRLSKIGRDATYDSINEDSSIDEKISLILAILKKSHSPKWLEYGKLNISKADEKVFNAKLRQTGLVTADDSHGYNPTFKLNDKGYLILDKYNDYLNYLAQNNSEAMPEVNLASLNQITQTSAKHFINPERLQQIKAIHSTKFDFSRLIQLCKEINDNFALGNYMSVAMVGRTILNHIPPTLNCKNFDEVANNYGAPSNTSFRKSMAHLNNTLKNIADSYLHQQIRNRESLPNETQINFSQDLDVLLAEIIRVS